MSFIVARFTTDNDSGDDNQHTIGHAEDVLRQACSDVGWVDVCPPSDAHFVCFQVNRQTYEYAARPPRANTTSHNEDVPEFDVNMPVDEDAFRLEDLEEFRHAIDPEDSIDDISTSLYRQSFTEGLSSFLQHQPAAQSTPSWPAPAQSLPPSLEEAGQPSIINDRLSQSNVNQSILSTVSASSNYDLQIQHTASVPQNRSAFSVPSGWTAENTSSRDAARRAPHILSTWPRESTSLFDSRPSHRSMGTRESPTREISHSEVSNLLHSTTVFSFPLAQRPRDVSDSTTSSHDLSGLRHAASWSVQDYMTSLYPENPHQLSSHITGEAQPQLSNPAVILDSPEVSSHQLADQPANPHEKSVSELLDPRSLSIPFSDQQPSAYQPLQPHPEDAYLDHSSLTPDASLASQPSAYRSGSQTQDRMARVLRWSLATNTMPHESPPSFRVPSPPPGFHSGGQPIGPDTSTGLNIPLSKSSSIPGLNAPPPAAQSELDRVSTPQPVREAPASPFLPSSSPIQDVTSTMSNKAILANAPRLVAPTKGGVGPRWKFPLVTRTSKGQKSVDADEGNDSTPSSPIQDFTILDAGLDVGVGDKEIHSPPGLRPSNTFFTGSSRIPEEEQLDEIPGEADISVVRHHLLEGKADGVKEGGSSATQSRGERDKAAQLDPQHGNNNNEDDLMRVSADNMKPELWMSMGSQQQITWTSSDEELYGTTSKSVLSHGPSMQGQNQPSIDEQEMVTMENTSIMVPRTEFGDQPILSPHGASRLPQAPVSQHSQGEKRELTMEGPAEEPPRKRRRIDTRSLYDLIPEPHIYTVPIPSTPNAMSCPVLPRQKANPKAYTTLNVPHLLPSSCLTVETLHSYLQDPYSRCAWIIPVRGAPPFPDCTTASVLDDDTHINASLSHLGDFLLPSGPTSKVAHQDSPGSITWTSEALRSLWRFLISVREAEKLGAVGLSFHCKNPFSISPNTPSGHAFGSVHNQSVDNLKESNSAEQPAMTAGGQSQSTSPNLNAVDYIKVYVDAAYAAGMRDVLHAWHYECLLPIQLGGEVTRLRLLRGARLVLLDERNRGVLTW